MIQGPHWCCGPHFSQFSMGSLMTLRRVIRLPIGYCLSLPVARRRNAGLPLCADACLLFAGLSHDNRPGDVRRYDQCPGIDASTVTGGVLFSILLPRLQPRVTTDMVALGRYSISPLPSAFPIPPCLTHSQPPSMISACLADVVSNMPMQLGSEKLRHGFSVLIHPRPLSFW